MTADVRDEGAVVATLASGLGFVEGPVWTTDGRLLVASLNRGHVYDVDLITGGATLLAEPGGGPNCLAQNRFGGPLWITQTAGAIMPSRSDRPTRVGLQRLDPDTGVIEDFPLDGVDSPSDCVVDSAGLVWFTDPPVHDVAAAPPTGALRFFDPSTGTVTTAAEGIAFPNGLAFSANEQHLFVSETSTRQILRFSRSGTALHRDDWTATLPAGHPDGLTVDAEGGLWVAGSDGANLCYIHPDGSVGPQVRFSAGSLVTSVAFVGNHHDVLAITNAKGGRVHTFRPEVADDSRAGAYL